MENSFKFLQDVKEALNGISASSYETIHIILGNESCDLDSTVSALALACLIKHQTEQCLVIPIMNVQARYFPLRTETCHVLKESGVDTSKLIFKEQIDLKHLIQQTNVKVHLVDHHVLTDEDKILEKYVVRIYDHRAVNSAQICQNQGLKSVIKPVGSCSTLIAQEIINQKPSILSKELSHLLYVTIIFDTIALEKNLGRTIDEDLNVAKHLEEIIKPEKSRKEIFDILWKVHNDVSTLKTKDLLFRDLKIVQGIPVPGLPLLVEDYFKRDDAVGAIKAFTEELNSEIAVIIGIDCSGDVKRDIGIFSKNHDLSSILIDTFKISGADLDLEEIPLDAIGIKCFRQGNVKLTRKFIIPLVNEAVNKIKQKN